MTRADRIRDYLRQNGATTPETAVPRSQIRVALGLDKAQTSSVMGDLKRAGFIAAVGEVRRLRFYVTRFSAAPLTPSEARERVRARHEARRRREGKAPRAEYLAACAARRNAKASDAAAAKAANKAKREAKRLADEQKRRITASIEAKRTAKRVAKVRAAVEVRCRFTSIAPVKAVEAWPSSEDFIKAGGVVQVLTNGEVSKPFRAIGFNNRRAAA